MLNDYNFTLRISLGTESYAFVKSKNSIAAYLLLSTFLMFCNSLDILIKSSKLFKHDFPFINPICFLLNFGDLAAVL